MSEQTAIAELEHYASALNSKIYMSQADLPRNDRPMPEMQAWCRRQGDIIVMQSGLILTSHPYSRDVQNCKIIMLHKGLAPGTVAPATPSLIASLIDMISEQLDSEHQISVSVSEQQQRLRQLVNEALLAQVSDIHLEVRKEIARIRFRKHGELYLHAEWASKLGRQLASVAFNQETDHSISHFNPSIAQNASMSLSCNEQIVRLRLASIPAHHGFDVVMRVLTTGKDAIMSLSDLGYLPEQVTQLSKASRMPCGAILIAGPTGSGKTTTVASCLEQVPHHRKVYTIEEPVEKVIDFTTQVPVNTDFSEGGFAKLGRAALRMDPDVIMLGEMRDEQTAKVMLRAALTGHLIFSTLHTNSAISIVPRLVDLGISPFLLADKNVLLALICQRLVPLLCTACAVPVTESPAHQPFLEEWKQLFGTVITSLKARGHDCLVCRGTGLSGRIVVAEIIWLDSAGREYIAASDYLGWENYLLAKGWTSYRERAIELIRQGRCDPLDVENIVGTLVI